MYFNEINTLDEYSVEWKVHVLVFYRLLNWKMHGETLKFCCNMFLFKMKSSGSHSQYLAKITHLVQSGYVELVQDVSVACVHSAHASQVTICNHNTDNVLYELYVSTLNQVRSFSKVLSVAPWWWFHCKPKHVGASSLILIFLKYFFIF